MMRLRERGPVASYPDGTGQLIWSFKVAGIVIFLTSTPLFLPDISVLYHELIPEDRETHGLFIVSVMLPF